jgi:hypothetical protein
MRSLIVRVLLFLAASFLATPAIGIAQDESPVQGAWIITSAESADGTVDSSPEPGLMLFTGTHYSIMLVLGDEPRTDLPDEPTDAEQVAAYVPFIANSGRYEVSGDEVTTRAYVAKYPNYMHGWPDNASTFTFAIDGDQLHLTFGSGAQISLRRVEGMQMPDDE